MARSDSNWTSPGPMVGRMLGVVRAPVLIGLCCLLLAAGGGESPAASTPERLPPSLTSYSFAVVPQHTATDLARRWSPLLSTLGRAGDINLRFETAPDIPTFEKRLTAGYYDFAYMNPYHYVVVQRTTGYRVFAKQGGPRLQGVVVVAAKSPLNTLKDLEGKRLALPSPLAFAASILTRVELTRRGIKFEPVYVSSHDSVYKGVAQGFFPAGGGIVSTLKLLDPATQAKLRVIWTSEPYVPHAIAAHPRVPQHTLDAVRDALIALAGTEEGRGQLAAIGMSAIEPAANKDYKAVRALEPTIARVLAE